MNPSPLRYPGGKYKLYSYVSELIKVNECTTYIEPFAGGSAISLELLFEGLVNRVIINDYDYTIYCFWKSILDYTDEFIDKIVNVTIDMDEWHREKRIREDIRSDLNSHSILEVGFSTFFLNRTNHSGIIDKAGPIGGMEQNGNYLIDCRFNKNNLIQKIQKIAKYKHGIEVYNLEAQDFIDQVILKTKKSFTFFDPPYYNKGPELYTNCYSHGDHENLSRHIATKMKNRKWIVTYDNVNAVKSMYKNIAHFEYELNYSLQSKRCGSEVMFMSKKVVRLEKDSEFIRVIDKKFNDKGYNHEWDIQEN